MVTADPGSCPVIFFVVSNKLQDKVNSFREVIEKKKLEVRRVCKEMRSFIEKKEEALIRELDTIWEEVEKKKTETQKEIEEIEKLSKEMEGKLCNLNPASIQFSHISEGIDLMKREMDIDIPNVKLTWRMDELRDSINRMCRCETKILVYNEETRYQPKCSKYDVVREDLNSFRDVIESKKLAVRRVSIEMKSLIEKKEEDTIRELHSIWEEVNTRVENKKTETQKEIEEIEKLKKEIEERLYKLNIASIQFSHIPKGIDLVKREMEIDIPYVKLTWRVDELKDCINRMCRCEQQILVYNEDTRYQLKLGKCEEGRGDNQLFQPWGIAINPMNENIYVADQWNHRVQIFSREGEWIRSVKDGEMKNPKNIVFHNQSIYVQCYTAILKLNVSTEKKEKSKSYTSVWKERFKSYDFYLRGICTDDIHIYAGQWKGMNLMVLTLDLIEEKRISLKTKFCKQGTQIRDISLSQELFYILLFNTDFPIQAFSKEGILTRCVVRKDSIIINCIHFLCLDQQHNILVADYVDSKVMIFSNEGKLLAQFGEKGSEKGQFQDLAGISVDEFGNILTVDRNNTHILQIFGPF